MTETKITKNGHTYIEVNYEDMTEKLNGGGICDGCGSINHIKNGYAIPVLNSVYCKECFDKWSSDAIYYEEDRSYESKKAKKILACLQQ